MSTRRLLMEFLNHSNQCFRTVRGKNNYPIKTNGVNPNMYLKKKFPAKNCEGEEEIAESQQKFRLCSKRNKPRVSIRVYCDRSKMLVTKPKIQKCISPAHILRLLRMFETKEKSGENFETVQDIAYKLVEEQIRISDYGSRIKENTIFILGSKGVGKTTVINKFFDRENEQTRPTLALEYSYGRRTSHSQSGGKQVLNIWELGSLENGEQLAEVPLRSHGIKDFAAVIMVDLSQPQRIWLDMENACMSLRNTALKLIKNEEENLFYLERAKERLRKNHVDLQTLELMPFPIVIVGGKYDLFVDLDPEQKKHICRCLRSVAHLIGGSLLFYSHQTPKLSKTLRDTISHLGFGSPSNPFRVHQTDYNEALSIWFGTDSWERIGIAACGFKQIGANLSIEIPQLQAQNAGKDMTLPSNPAKDPGFRESVIDEMRA